MQRVYTGCGPYMQFRDNFHGLIFLVAHKSAVSNGNSAKMFYMINRRAVNNLTVKSVWVAGYQIQSTCINYNTP